MGGTDDWLRVALNIRGEAAPNPITSRQVGEIYALAVQAAPRILSSFRDIDEGDKTSMAAEVITGKLRAIVNAENPYSYFRQALFNRANDVMRASTRLEWEGPDGPREIADINLVPDLDQKIDQERTLRSCSERDQQILCALAFGETPEDLGRVFGMTRDAIYQIQSRFRRRHGA